MIRNGWRIFKEFYADGPSLFVWVALSDTERHDFNRRKDAVAFAEAHPGISPQDVVVNSPSCKMMS